MDEQLYVLISAIETVYDPLVDNERRKAASQALEASKELDPRCVETLAYALIGQKNIYMSHVGWNYLEHIIKFKWLELDSEARLSVRNGCFLHLFDEQMAQNELCNAAARCVETMVEHEWPQHWPELFDQLDKVSVEGNPHLPFLVFQRLIENVITLGTIENVARKKDLNSAIATNISRILNMILLTLKNSACCTSEGIYPLVRRALLLLGEIVGWLRCRTLESQIDEFVTIVCAFLGTAELGIREAAAHCLWCIASRRLAKSEESEIVLALFGDLPMQTILTAASAAANVGADNYEHYKFLKELCNVLSALGVHLCDVWKVRPLNFKMYLSAIEAFFNHQSIYLRTEAASVFASFIAHKDICEDELFGESICRVINAIPLLIEKVGHPSKNDCETCRYSQHDYDDDIEFSQHHNQFRDRCLKIVRLSCVGKYAVLPMNLIENWLETRFLVNINTIRETEWDSMNRLSKLVLSIYYDAGFLNEAIMNKLIGTYDAALSMLDANNISSMQINCILSVISALSVIFYKLPHLVIPLLTQFRNLITTKNDDDYDEKSVKRHCIALLLKLITTYGNAIMDQAQLIFEFCLSVRQFLSPMQLASSLQVIAALSNLCIDYATQCNFLSSAIAGSVQYFLQPNIQCILESDLQFLIFFGFTVKAPLGPDEVSKSPFLQNRLTFRANLTAIEGVLAYARSIRQDSHPAFESIKPILSSYFMLAQRLNSLGNPQNFASIHPSYGPAIFEMTTSERHQTLMSAHDICTTSNSKFSNDDPVDYARNFIVDLGFSTQMILSYISTKMKLQLFNEPNIAIWVSRLASDVNFVPDFRLRFWVRRTWSPLFCSCPESVYISVRDSLQTLIKELTSRLTRRWDELAAAQNSGELTQDEFLTEHMACALSRETVAFLRDLLLLSDNSSACDKADNADDNVDNKTATQCYIKAQFIEDKGVMEDLVVLLFGCLTFRDASTVIRVIPPCLESIRMLSKTCSDEMAMYMLIHSIQGIQIHGSDDLVLNPLLLLIFSIYAQFADQHECLVRVMEQVPERDAEALEKLNQRIAVILMNGSEGLEKNKREVMKKFLRPLIGKSIGEQFRRPVQLRALPPLFKKKKDMIDANYAALGLIFDDDND